MKKIVLAALVCTCLAAPAWADPTFGFYKLTNNNVENLSSQLSVVVSDAGSNQVLFKFFNNVGIASSITDVYFDDGTLLESPPSRRAPELRSMTLPPLAICRAAIRLVRPL
ncbi:MAG TPA: hypothetical protein PK373_11010 [Sedimentisphaerales bacterium]|nr:hypothetical protein [Sedimentisphaerales bacterium]